MRNRKLDEISFSAYKIISTSYLKRIRNFIEQVVSNPDILQIQKVFTADSQAINAAATLIVKSLLTGIDSASTGKRFDDQNIDISELPFEEAVLYLSKKDILPAAEYYKLSDKARFRSFTVSRIADGDIMERVKALLVENLNEGKSLSDFLRKTDTEILNGCGLGGKGGGWYWENVYRTNVQTAYNVGRAIGYEAVPPIALELVGIGDSRQTDICRSLTQPPVRKLYTDAFWKTHWPPFHFGCRTTVRAIYDPAELQEKPVSEPVSEEKPQKGFGTYPINKGNWWRELASMVRRAKKYGIQKEIEIAKKIIVDKKITTLADAKTTADVEKIMKDKNWFISGSNEKVSLTGADFESAKSIFIGYEKLFTKYPQLKNKFEEIIVKRLGQRTYARSFLMSGKIEVNKVFYKDYKNLVEQYKNDVKSKWHPEGTDADGIILHELGHNINGFLSIKKNMPYQTISVDIKREVLKRCGLSSKKDVEDGLSRYAAVKPSEFFAEAFCEFISSKQPRLIARIFGEVLTEWLK